MAKPTPLLAQVDLWFDREIVPKRTAWAGFSPNRIYKTPNRLFAGNKSDPDGLCGDASTFVIEAFNDTFNYPWTPDGYQIGLALWEGAFSNHIASAMLLQKKTALQEFRYVGGVLIRPTLKQGKLLGGSPAFAATTMTEAELLDIHIYDLYYRKRTNLGSWWEEIGGKRGTVRLGLESDFA